MAVLLLFLANREVLNSYLLSQLMSYLGKYFIDTIAAYKFLLALLNLKDRLQL